MNEVASLILTHLKTGIVIIFLDIDKYQIYQYIGVVCDIELARHDMQLYHIINMLNRIKTSTLDYKSTQIL